MEKRFQMRAEGINISAIVVLTPSEQEILECKDLEKSIDNIATDLHVAWAVEINGNIATATISKQFGPVVGDEQSHDVEIAATNFMSGVRKLHVPCDKQLDVPKNNEDENSALEKELEFVRSILESPQEESPGKFGIAGVVIMGRSKYVPIDVQIGSFPYETFKRMLESYVKVYSHEHE